MAYQHRISTLVIVQIDDYIPSGRSRSERSLAVLSVVITTLCFSTSSIAGALKHIHKH